MRKKGVVMKFLIGGSLILLALLKFPLTHVVIGVEVIIVLLFIYLTVSVIKNKGKSDEK